PFHPDHVRVEVVLDVDLSYWRTDGGQCEVAGGEDAGHLVDLVISEIQKLNALNGGSLQAGQQLAIPAEYAD
ncbi:MAG: hypothetical protein V4703_09810, partial [Actinomycetota bacterium]